jgi:hypothetical protein
MRSYIKIYGPPVYEAIRALEKLAFDVPEVTIMDTIIEFESDFIGDEDAMLAYFSAIPELEVTKTRSVKIISRSGARTGDYDFYFEWAIKPSMGQLNALIMKIDDALKSLGCKYTITTRR